MLIKSALRGKQRASIDYALVCPPRVTPVVVDRPYGTQNPELVKKNPFAHETHRSPTITDGVKK